MDLKNYVGSTAGPYEEEISADRIAAFARALGARDKSEASPTFLTICRRGELELFNRLGVPVSRVLHGEQEYELKAPVRAGDRVSYTTRVAQASGRRAMQFYVLETEVSANREGQVVPVGVARSTIVVKGD